MALQKFILSIFLLSSLFIFICCSSDELNSKPETGKIDSNHFIFIEYQKKTDGKILKGYYPPGKRIDGRVYSYQADSGKILVLRQNLVNNHSFKILLGMSLTLTGAAGSGISSILVTIDSLPFYKDPLTIKNIITDGTVTLAYKNKSRNLSIKMRQKIIKIKLHVLSLQVYLSRLHYPVISLSAFR